MQTPRKLFGGLGNQMFQMAYIYSQFRDGVIPDIYIQNYKLWEKHKEEIIKWYRGENGKRPPIFKVSLHIRRGDYVNNPYYVDLTQTDYYDKAIDYFFPSTEFLVFCADRQDGSDDGKDQEWVMNWLETKYGKRFTLYKGFSEVDDMNTMMLCCMGHIIANSSFSWWGAFLGDCTKGGSPNIAPKQWFVDGRSIPLPDNWTIL